MTDTNTAPAQEFRSKPASSRYGPKTEPARQPRVLSIANQKGGVGKTTTAINLGTALAAIGEKSADRRPRPAGQRLDRPRHRRAIAAARLMTCCSDTRRCARRRGNRGAAAAHRASTFDLSGLELEIGQARDRAFRLRWPSTMNDRRRKRLPYVLVDCPPSLNLLTVNAMAAANAILVPLQCEFFALEGLSQLIKTVDQVKSTLNPGLTIHGIVLTMSTRATISPIRLPPMCANSWAAKCTIR